MPERLRRVGLQEIGLPYAADAAVTRHLARFLRRQSSGGTTAPAIHDGARAASPVRRTCSSTAA